ncbi:hypothetical protein VOLCADRAFT_61058 [Volvox carteri f. nagariensis]|uniref:protein-serine/threonine phosphatase n=1 Tax=Volvox carteri f. nagariensis TaxID=3068 RepID=D8TX27_VOLCA|nr:uncharacterized protein VOLCADRAFT_61058 [Volvox carteri f. nagariensis]EFJ47935.1 hypothetical protein VOLCADRAFT_61058 [Volvox carteri f. nagariensis]|eukprot:XP_002951041.1 hypothetical protein VOLCADRAFT_61058 [Volvox carteri f. nagariensis]
MKLGSLCGAADSVAPQPLSFQRQASACLGALRSCPAHGVKAVCGKRNKMEDMYAVQPNFCDIPLASDTLHFFGVYDGHGGCQAAEHCAKRLHHHLSRSIATACGYSIADGNQLMQAPEADGSQVDWSISSSLMQSAFVKTDAEFANDGCAAMVGSTALVALVGTRKVWLANCGDSRAVLCRAGKAIQLTDDHKPEREDEAERVEKAGGQVLYWNGHRVMGVLAMSRAIGDHGLRPYIIPEPEVSVVCRTEDDDFLLLASDGLWDVMANQEATNLCIRCIKRAREKGASRNAAVRIAASVLTKAAIDRGSKDNVTVVIVDLRNDRPGAGGAAAPAPSDVGGVVDAAPGRANSANGVGGAVTAPAPGAIPERMCTGWVEG